MEKSFSEVLQLIIKFTNFGGFYEFNGYNYVPSRKDLIRRYICLAAVLLILTFISTTILLSDESVVHKVIIGLVQQIILNIALTAYSLSRNRLHYLSLFEWCQKIYNFRTHSFIDAKIVYRLDCLNDLSVKIVKLVANISIMDVIFGTFIGGFVGHLLPDYIYPDFQPPLPIVLPVRDRDNWTVFLVTLLMQFSGGLVAVLLVAIVLIVIVTICLHIDGYLDVLLIVLKEMKGIMDNDYETVMFQNLMKLSVDMTCDAHRYVHLNDKTFSFESFKLCIFFRTMHSLSKLISGTVLIWEVQAYEAIFISGMIIIAERTSYVLGIAVSIIFVFYFIVCFLSNKIMEKVYEVQFALYDLPWFKLSTRERKLLATTMHLANLNWGLSVGGFYQATLERFAMIVKSAAKSCLVICDIMKKY